MASEQRAFATLYTSAEAHRAQVRDVTATLLLPSCTDFREGYNTSVFRVSVWRVAFLFRGVSENMGPYSNIVP